MKTRTLRSIVYLAAGLGLIVSILAAAEYFEASLRSFCTVSTFFSCSAVDNSGQTTTLDVPDYLWGVLGFIAILIVAGIAEYRKDDVRWTYLLLLITTGGVAISIYFAYVELALIHALCPVCLTAYIFGAIAWLGAIGLTLKALRKARRRKERAEAEPDAARNAGEPA